MNKRALLLTAATVALFSGPAIGGQLRHHHHHRLLRHHRGSHHRPSPPARCNSAAGRHHHRNGGHGQDRRPRASPYPVKRDRAHRRAEDRFRQQRHQLRHDLQQEHALCHGRGDQCRTERDRHHRGHHDGDYSKDTLRHHRSVGHGHHQDRRICSICPAHLHCGSIDATRPRPRCHGGIPCPASIWER